MILLSGHSLTPARKVPVEALSLILKERESTASMTPADMEGITTESWFLDDKEPGAGVVWRVRSIGTAYATNTPTVQLEHAISTLKDKILFGETKPENISGGSTCTARQAVEYILRQQGDWVLGQFDYSVTNAYKFDGDSLFDCLEAVTDTLDDPWWSYDMTRYPFRLNITRRSSGVESELRCGRNLRTITRTIDRSGMYTRFYPIGKDDLHLAGTPYVERNANLYGVIEHTETDTSRETDGELRSWANEKLARHAEPVVNIEVEGLELVESTGEALDRLRLGRMCRVPLPEFGTTITERIVSLTYQDKIHQPEVVRITLANNRDDVTRIIAENMKSGGRGGRGAARQAKQDHAWFEDTNDHVAMVAEGIVGVDAEGNPNWTLLSEIIVDGTGIHQDVVETQNGLTLAETHIEQNSRAITLEAQRASTAEGTLSGRITVAADAITQEVTRATTAEGTLSGRITVTADAINQEVTRAKGAEGTLSGRITTEAGKIALVVEEKDGQNVIKAASIVTAVNSAGSTVAISADHVSISGDTKLSGTMTIDNGSLVVKKSAVFQGNVTLTDANGYVQAKKFAVASGGSVQFIGSGAGESYSLTASNIQGFIKEASVDGNVLTLTPVHGDAITFSKATSLSGAWSSNTYTVTASPQGTTLSTSIDTRFGADQCNYYVEAYRSSDSGAPGISGASITYQLANNEGTIEIQDTNGTKISNTPTLTLDFEEKTITANGTYTPSGSNIGFSKVVVNVSASGGGDKARFNSGEGQYFIEAYDNASGTSVAGSSLAYLLTAEYISGSGIEVQIQDTGGTKLGNTRTCPIWLLSSNSGVNNQGTLAYDTYYGISSGNTILATWKTPAAPTHSPSIDSVWTSDRTPSGGTQLNSLKTQYENAKADGDFFCIRVDCYGTKKTYYCEP